MKRKFLIVLEALELGIPIRIPGFLDDIYMIDGQVCTKMHRVSFTKKGVEKTEEEYALFTEMSLNMFIVACDKFTEKEITKMVADITLTKMKRKRVGKNADRNDNGIKLTYGKYAGYHIWQCTTGYLRYIVKNFDEGKIRTEAIEELRYRDENNKHHEKDPRTQEQIDAYTERKRKEKEEIKRTEDRFVTPYDSGVDDDIPF